MTKKGSFGVLLSSGYDGSVRAFDLNKYRNFRVMTTSKKSSACQLNCLAVDSNGEIVCAGALDPYDIFVWNVKNGHLVQVLSGHTAMITSLSFNQNDVIII